MKLLTYTEAAATLGVSRRTLYNMIERGTIEPVYVPRPSGAGTVPRLHPDQIHGILLSRLEEL